MNKFEDLPENSEKDNIDAVLCKIFAKDSFQIIPAYNSYLLQFTYCLGDSQIFLFGFAMGQQFGKKYKLQNITQSEFLLVLR